MSVINRAIFQISLEDNKHTERDTERKSERQRERVLQTFSQVKCPGETIRDPTLFVEEKSAKKINLPL